MFNILAPHLHHVVKYVCLCKTIICFHNNYTKIIFLYITSEFCISKFVIPAWLYRSLFCPNVCETINFTLNTVKKNLLLILNRNFIFIFFRKKKINGFLKNNFFDVSSTFSLGLFLLFITYVHVLVESLPDEFLSKEGCCLLRITYNLIFVKKGMHIISYFSFQMTWTGGRGVAVVNAC